MTLTFKSWLIVVATPLVLALVGSSDLDAATKRKGAPPAGSLQTYWEAFSAAFGARNAAKVASMTKFPLTVRGGLDDDPEHKLDRAAFERFFARFIEDRVSVDDKETSLLELVTATKTLTADQYDPSAAHLASLSFRFANGKWALTRVTSDKTP